MTLNDIRPAVSVVTASHRPAYVTRLLDALGPGATGVAAVEIIVVCDYEPAGLVKRYPRIRWIHHPDRSIPAKRNKGISAAAGAVVAFIDDDCRPLDGWVPAALEYLRLHPEAAGVEGKTVIERIDGGAAGSLAEYKRLERQGYRTNNIFYRKNALLEAGMFDERFTVQREDIDLAFTILSKGHEIGYQPEIKVEHAFRKGEKWDLLKNCVNRRFDPLLFGKHPALYRRHIGSPFTPGIAVIFGMHLLVTAASASAGLRIGAAVAMLDAAAVLLFILRKRDWKPAGGAAQLLREWASFWVSPFVLLVALMYGSVKFRRFLIV